MWKTISLGVVGLMGSMYTCTCVALAVCSTLTVDEAQKSLVQPCVCEDDPLVYASSIKFSAVAFLWH